MDKARKKALKDKKRKEAQRKVKANKPSLRAPNEYLKKSLELMRAGNDSKAESLINEGLRLYPDVKELYANKVAILQRLGRPTEAMAVARQALAIDETHPDSHNNLGALLKFSGELEEARTHFKRASELAPGNGEIWRNLTSVTKYTDEADPEIALIRSHADRLRRDPNAEASIFFAAGKALEDVGSFDESFNWYQKGNTQMRNRAPYRREEFTRLVDIIIESQSSAFFTGPAIENAPEDSPIFIIGMPRSGSSLVEQILASHPEVSGTGELPELGRTLGPLSPTTAGRVNAIASAHPQELARLGRLYCDRMRRHASGADRFTDKYLSNFIHLGFLHKALPNARFIHSRREAMDNCFACFKVLFTSNVPFTYNLEDIAHWYQELYRLMAHWNEFIPGKILELDYEELVQDQEGNTRKLLDFCGLPWHDDCMRFFETKRIVHSASSTQVRRPMYKSSVAKWKKYETHLTPLQEALEKYLP